MEATPSKNKRTRWLGVVLPTLILLAAFLAPPWSLEQKAHLIGYGICHQIPERSLQPDGRPLPLCARCTGTFVGALLSFIAVLALRRGKAQRMPPPVVLATLVLFILTMGLDGINSYSHFFPNAPHLYEPTNTLRIVTGTLSGIGLALILQPIISFTALREPEDRAAIDNLFTLLGVVAVGLLAALVALAEWPWTYYPLTWLSAFAVLFMLMALNGVILVMVSRKENTVTGWRDALPFVLWGTVLALIELGVIDLLRAWLTARYGLPI